MKVPAAIDQPPFLDKFGLLIFGSSNATDTRLLGKEWELSRLQLFAVTIVSILTVGIALLILLFCAHLRRRNTETPLGKLCLVKPPSPSGVGDQQQNTTLGVQPATAAATVATDSDGQSTAHSAGQLERQGGSATNEDADDDANGGEKDEGHEASDQASEHPETPEPDPELEVAAEASGGSAKLNSQQEDGVHVSDDQASEPPETPEPDPELEVAAADSDSSAELNPSQVSEVGIHVSDDQASEPPETHESDSESEVAAAAGDSSAELNPSQVDEVEEDEVHVPDDQASGPPETPKSDPESEVAPPEDQSPQLAAEVAAADSGSSAKLNSPPPRSAEADAVDGAPPPDGSDEEDSSVLLMMKGYGGRIAAVSNPLPNKIAALCAGLETQFIEAQESEDALRPEIADIFPTGIRILKDVTSTTEQLETCAAFFRIVFRLKDLRPESRTAACCALLANFADARASGLVFLAAESLADGEELPSSCCGIVKSEDLGSGSYNSIVKIKTADSRAFAFKENNANAMEDSKEGNCEAPNARAAVNLGANVIAEELGHGFVEHILKSQCAVVEDMIGLAMDVVNQELLGVIAPRKNKKLYESAKFRKQATAIQIFHFITGNNDGHAGNVFAGRKTYDLIAFDHDQSFSPYIDTCPAGGRLIDYNGFYGCGMPVVIDEEQRDAIIALNESEIRKKLRRVGLRDEQIDDCLSNIKKLKKRIVDGKIRVIAPADWANSDFLRDTAGCTAENSLFQFYLVQARWNGIAQRKKSFEKKVLLGDGRPCSWPETIGYFDIRRWHEAGDISDFAKTLPIPRGLPDGVCVDIYGRVFYDGKAPRTARYDGGKDCAFDGNGSEIQPSEEVFQNVDGGAYFRITNGGYEDVDYSSLEVVKLITIGNGQYVFGDKDGKANMTPLGVYGVIGNNPGDLRLRKGTKDKRDTWTVIPKPKT
ncbi:MAG: hypothetical protein LBB38_03060 [Puniceicoccales bacterium]|jgi:hypothetical protein|nr:hypothetical protein [Puniceicoccales bacterium]